MEVELLASLLLEEFELTLGEAYDLARWILKRFELRKTAQGAVIDLKARQDKAKR